jgi:hypothetical protein
MSTISNEAGTQGADIREDANHQTRTSDNLTAEPVINRLTHTDVDRSVGGLDERPDHGRRRPSHVFGWLMVAVAVVASVVLAQLALEDDQSTRLPIPDAKDNPNFGPVVVPPVVGDTKDHVGYGPVVTSSIGDAKDNPNFGPVVVPPAVGDAKDHVGYGMSTATCRLMSEPASRYCPPAG